VMQRFNDHTKELKRLQIHGSDIHAGMGGVLQSSRPMSFSVYSISVAAPAAGSSKRREPINHVPAGGVDVSNKMLDYARGRPESAGR